MLVFLSAWWWYTIKPARKYILLFCVSFVGSMTAHITGDFFDIYELKIIAGFIFLGAI